VQNWDDIRNEFETSNITLAALAEKYGIKVGTLKSRKSREGWTRGSPENAAKKDATKTEKVATLKKKVATKKEDSSNEEITLDNSLDGSQLTEKQRLFCLYYVKNFNATQAATNAGYAPDRAHVTGSELVRNRKVADYIRSLKGSMTEELFLEALDVLRKYMAIAFADITDYVSFGQREEQVMGMYGPVFTGKGKDKKPVMQTVNYVNLKGSSGVDGTIITEVKQGKDGVSIKLADKMKALEVLTKYTDLLSENAKKKLQEEKIKADIARIKGDPEDEYEDDGFIEALEGKVQEVWDDEDET